MRNAAILLLLISSICCSCGKPKEKIPYNPPPELPPAYSTVNKNDSSAGTKTFKVKIVSKISHDEEAFTQGLYYYKGIMFESNGQYGSSNLRKLEPATGSVIKKVSVPALFFAEGMTILDDKIYMLTWTSGKCFVYNTGDLKQTGSFDYQGEGWGLTSDGSSLIMSDGSNVLRYVNPENFSVEKTVNVNDNGTPIGSLNELEMIDGYIWANIWGLDRIAVINPADGSVKAWVDASPMRDYVKGNDRIDVINGIAYDKDTKSIYLTGKYWPWMFIIEYIKVD